MNNLLRWVRQHPILVFLAWFFPVGWAIVFIPQIAMATAGMDLPIEPFIILSTWFGLLLPVVVIVRLVVGSARLQTRYGVLLAVLITAVLFALQHVPLFVGQSMGFVIPVAFFVLTIPFRALMAWIYNRTDSLFVVGLVHAAGDGAIAGTITGV